MQKAQIRLLTQDRRQDEKQNGCPLHGSLHGLLWQSSRKNLIQRMPTDISEPIIASRADSHRILHDALNEDTHFTAMVSLS